MQTSSEQLAHSTQRTKRGTAAGSGTTRAVTRKPITGSTESTDAAALSLPAHQPQPITRSVVEVLLEAQVALGGLDGGVAQRDLDLLERRPAEVGELGEGPS